MKNIFGATRLLFSNFSFGQSADSLPGEEIRNDFRPVFASGIGSLLLFINFATAQIPNTTSGQTSVDTSFLLKVNGVGQYLEIKGASRTNPVLLFIHGGPSWPATPMIRKFNQDLTKDFVPVSWDQRNCGKSGSGNTAKLSPALYVEDAH